MSIGKLEAFLGKHIEGFFNKKFSSSLEFPEVAKQLQREVMHKKKKCRRGATVPNAYFIDMNNEDYQRMCVRRYKEELHTVVEKAVIENDSFMDNTLSIVMNSREDLKPGVCNVWSRYQDETYAEEVRDDIVSDDAGDETRVVKPARASTELETNSSTIVLNRSEFKPPLNLPEEYKLVSLLAVEGPDIDSYLEFGEKQIYIGRRVKNDFILTDTNASRVHAYIAYERHRHVLYDAESLNGTFVNGTLLEEPCILKAGDEIQIGNTVLLYDVIKD